MKVKASAPSIPMVTIKLEYEEAYTLYEGLTGENTGMTSITTETVLEMLVAGLRSELQISQEGNLFAKSENRPAE